MSFCSFSREFNENAYTAVENQFITKYMPGADDFAVKVYLYGLYLCQNSDSDFNVFSMAEVLKTTREKIEEAFAFWEDYDLVEILSHEPFVVNYLPVRSAVGRPKKSVMSNTGISTRNCSGKCSRWGNSSPTTIPSNTCISSTKTTFSLRRFCSSPSIASTNREKAYPLPTSSTRRKSLSETAGLPTNRWNAN